MKLKKYDLTTILKRSLILSREELNKRTKYKILPETMIINLFLTFFD